MSINEGNDGRVLVHCFVCSQEQVIDALRSRGLWPNSNVIPIPRRPEDVDRDRDRERERIAQATRIWNEGVDPLGTIAEQYLASRKLILPLELRMSVLRFHPQCPWERQSAPCLIVAFTGIRDNDIRAIHRIRLDEPERWPKTQRLMLGPVAGAAVKLDPGISDRLVIGEGIETCMAARQLGFGPVWALGSAGGIEKLAPIVGVDELIILGERDNGRNFEAAAECCKSWGKSNTFLMMPPSEFKDFNDLLMEIRNAAA